MKRKKLTQREKALNARVKKELQEEGFLPPDKPRLNRKKFAEEVLKEYQEQDYGIDIYIARAIWLMVSTNAHKVTPEQVGVLKLLKIAMETRKFEQALPEGTKKYSIEEYLKKVVFPIEDL